MDQTQGTKKYWGLWQSGDVLLHKGTVTPQSDGFFHGHYRASTAIASDFFKINKNFVFWRSCVPVFFNHSVGQKKKRERKEKKLDCFLKNKKTCYATSKEWSRDILSDSRSADVENENGQNDIWVWEFVTSWFREDSADVVRGSYNHKEAEFQPRYSPLPLGKSFQ